MDPFRTLGANASDHLRAPLLEPPRLRTLVRDPEPCVHLVKSELFDELGPCIGRDFVRLDVGGTVGFVVEDLREDM
jgi:hypothetical protein